MRAWTGKNNGNDVRTFPVAVAIREDLPITFTLRRPMDYIPILLTPYYDRRWSCMMEKAGYLQRTGCRALDNDGVMHEVIEIHIHGLRYALRRDGLAGAITGRVFVQVEELTHNWNYYLGSTCGLAQVSVSGKALNIDLFNDGSFTVSLRSLRNVMYGKDRYAFIMKIPEQSMQLYRTRRVAQDQKRISAAV